MKTALATSTLTAAATLVLALAPEAQAQFDQEFGPRAGHVYVSGTAQYTVERDVFGVNNTVDGGDTSYETEFDDVGFAGAIGMHLGYGFRAEIEGSHREMDVTGLGNFPFNTTGEGDLDLTSLMANIYFDQPLIRGVLDAYVGVGAGVTMTRGSVDYSQTLTFVQTTNGAVTRSTETDGFSGTRFAASVQAMAGLNLHLGHNLTLFGGYRGFYYGGADYESQGAVLDNTFFHGAEAGVRLTF